MAKSYVSCTEGGQGDQIQYLASCFSAGIQAVIHSQEATGCWSGRPKCSPVHYRYAVTRSFADQRTRVIGIASIFSCSASIRRTGPSARRRSSSVPSRSPPCASGSQSCASTARDPATPRSASPSRFCTLPCGPARGFLSAHCLNGRSEACFQQAAWSASGRSAHPGRPCPSPETGRILKLGKSQAGYCLLSRRAALAR